MPPASATKKPSVVYGPLVTAAILALKERQGSSIAAIKKWLAANHPEASNESAIKVALKNGVAKSNLVKIKASYKVSDTGKKAMKPAKKKAAKPKAAATKVRVELPSKLLTAERPRPPLTASLPRLQATKAPKKENAPKEKAPAAKKASPKAKKPAAKAKASAKKPAAKTAAVKKTITKAKKPAAATKAKKATKPKKK
jgi:histone H1/5